MNNGKGSDNKERVVDKLFSFIRTKGQLALAHSNDEKVRMILLDTLQELDRYEIAIHKEYGENLAVLMKGSLELDESILAELPSTVKIIKIEDGESK